MGRHNDWFVDYSFYIKRTFLNTEKMISKESKVKDSNLQNSEEEKEEDSNKI